MTFRLRLFLSHAFLSALLVGALAAAVLLVWYPPPLFALQGAIAILLTVIFVDVIIGPLLTLVVASPKKPRRELIRDLSIIVGLQVAALAYGMHSLFAGRPAFLVFSEDQFHVVTANQLVDHPQLPYRNPALASPPIWGPVWVAALPPESKLIRSEIEVSVLLGGPNTKDFPALYVLWPASAGVDADSFKPLSQLMATSREGLQTGEAATRKSGLAVADLSYVPLVGRERSGVVVLDRKTLASVHLSDVSPSN